MNVMNLQINYNKFNKAPFKSLYVDETILPPKFIYTPISSFAHLGDGKTLAFLTNVRDDYHYHFRQTGVLDRCTGQVHWTSVLAHQ